MTNFFTKKSTRVLWAVVFVVVGVLFGATRAQAQSGSLYSPSNTIKPANGWLSVQNAENLVQQQINLNQQYVDFNTPGTTTFKMAKARLELYRQIAQRLDSGMSVQDAINDSYNKVSGDMKPDTPNSPLTIAQLHTIYVEAVDLLSN